MQHISYSPSLDSHSCYLFHRIHSICQSLRLALLSLLPPFSVMAPQFDSPPRSPDRFSKPRPRHPKSPAQSAQIRVQNRRRAYLERNAEYFKSTEHELAGL